MKRFISTFDTITAARWVSLLAAFVWGAVAEYKLGVAVGVDAYTAALLPMVLDVYGFAAMKVGRTSHVVGALAGMVGTQIISHLLTLGHAPTRMVVLSIGISALVPSISLACHRLGAHRATPAVADDTVDVAPVDADDTVDAPVDTAPVAPVAPVVTPAAPVVIPVETIVYDDVDDDAALSKREYAVKGASLVAAGYTKTDAAAELGISRQWLHACMKEFTPANA